MHAIRTSIQKLLSFRIVRSLLSGVVAVIFQTFIFEVLAIYTQLVQPSTATLIGAECALLLNFCLNHFFSFRGTHNKDPLFLRLLRYHAVVSGSILIQWSSLFVTERLTTDSLIIHAVYFMSIVVGFAWNYTWYKLWVWRHHHE